VTRNAVVAPGASAIGPYSHAIWAGKRLYLSGQTPVDPATGELVQGDVAAQAEQCFRNLFAVLDAAGLGPDSVVKVNVYLTDMGDFAAMNEVYARQFAQPFPARTTVAVAALPRGARIEIEMIARRGGKPEKRAKKEKDA
jgi:2-iminobutanoate/2-iminopropanoate deaminase